MENNKEKELDEIIRMFKSNDGGVDSMSGVNDVLSVFNDNKSDVEKESDEDFEGHFTSFQLSENEVKVVKNNANEEEDKSWIKMEYQDDDEQENIPYNVFGFRPRLSSSDYSLSTRRYKEPSNRFCLICEPSDFKQFYDMVEDKKTGELCEKYESCKRFDRDNKNVPNVLIFEGKMINILGYVFPYGKLNLLNTDVKFNFNRVRYDDGVFYEISLPKFGLKYCKPVTFDELRSSYRDAHKLADVISGTVLRDYLVCIKYLLIEGQSSMEYQSRYYSSFSKDPSEIAVKAVSRRYVR